MIQRNSYQGDPRIGFFLTFTGGRIIAARKFTTDLEVEVLNTSISRSRLTGLYTAGNSRGLLVPNSITDREKSALDEQDVDYLKVDSKLNAFGNLIVVNDKGAIVHPELESVKQEISEFLEVPVTTGKVAGIPNAGACVVANNQGAVIHRDADENDAEMVKEALEVKEVAVGTVNQGSPFVNSGLVASEQHAVTGSDTTGPEIGRIDRTLF